MGSGRGLPVGGEGALGTGPVGSTRPRYPSIEKNGINSSILAPGGAKSGRAGIPCLFYPSIPQTPFKLYGYSSTEVGLKSQTAPRDGGNVWPGKDLLNVGVRSVVQPGRIPGVMLPGLLPTPQVTLSGGLLTSHCNLGLWRDAYAVLSAWS